MDIMNDKAEREITMRIRDMVQHYARDQITQSETKGAIFALFAFLSSRTGTLDDKAKAILRLTAEYCEVG